MKISVYPYSGSKNHGCEALARSLARELSGHKLSLFSKNPSEDYAYGLEQLYSIDTMHIDLFKNPDLFHCTKLSCENNSRSWHDLEFYNVIHSDCDVAVCTGGDEYCYPSQPPKLAYINQFFQNRHIPTMLWGCSIEPSLLQNKDIISDLKSYNAITSRESISYHALKEAGIDNVEFSADPAFLLPSAPVKLPKRFLPHNTIGINCSPLVISRESEDGIILKNYIHLINWLLKNTKMNIALIPHVVWDDNDDRAPAAYLANVFRHSRRICMIDDCNCMELKGFISQLRFLICARTHASIAAYSNSIPTLVVGYSVKSRGIAQDLFGSYDNYVLASSEISQEDDLLNKFIWIYENEYKIKDILNTVLPKYLETIKVSTDLVNSLKSKSLHQPSVLNITDKKSCCGCHACHNICPVQAIQMESDEEGFLYPKINADICISCGKCADVCPITSYFPPADTMPKAYAAYSRDDTVRTNSSSGGIFYHLAEAVIKQNGYVFGAQFSSNYEVVHDSIHTINDICKLQTSKYVQSKIQTSYADAEALLKKDVPVLFTGTPCQIYGLKKYLNKDYPSLYTQDFICHGVPSPLFLQYYMKTVNLKFDSPAEQINFHDKITGWYNFSFSASNSKEVFTNYYEDDLYMKLFLHNSILRPSCYECRFRNVSRISDITLADFWGIDMLDKTMYDDMGTSLVLLQNDKGVDLFQKIFPFITHKGMPLQESITPNPSAYSSPSMPCNRKYLFDLLPDENMQTIVDIALSDSIPYNIFKQ